MKALKSLCEKNGCVDVQTYIQSGNVIFRSALSDASLIAKQLTDSVSRGHGFEPRVVVLTLDEIEHAAAGNPFPEAAKDPKSLHLFFLAEVPRKPDLKSFESLRTKNERFELKATTLYLHTPDGFGRSKLAARAEKLLGVAATARNWRTVTTLLEMAKTVP
jgi:uncharacterized protein (DUF1697 family)